MNYQPLIDNLPYELVALGFVFWALARAVEAYAKRNPAIDKWDTRAEQLHMVADKYSQAIEWLVSTGAARWSGTEKLAELNKRVKEFEADWDAGNYLEALSKLSGFYQSAMSKIQKVQGAVLPFVTPLPTSISPRVSGSLVAPAGIGPDDPAQETNEA